MSINEISSADTSRYQLQNPQGNLTNLRTTIQAVASRLLGFDDAIEALSRNLDAKKYLDAYTQTDQLFHRELTQAQRKQLLDHCKHIASLGKETIGNEFYAYVRTVVTHDLEEKKVKQKDIIDGYKEALALGNSTAGYNLAQYQKSKRKYKDALETWKMCAQKFPNKPIFCNEVGKCYQFGTGTKKDLLTAKTWFKKGAERHHAGSEANLAFLLQTTHSKSQQVRNEVIDLYTRAKTAHYSKAAFNLGVIFQTGWYKTDQNNKELCNIDHVDLQKAEEHFREAYTMNKEQLENPDAYIDPDEPTIIEREELEDDMIDSALAIVEILLDDTSRNTPERRNEMLQLIKLAKDHGRDVSLIEAKINTEKTANNQKSHPPVAAKAPMKRLLGALQEDEAAEEETRKTTAELLLQMVAAKAPASKAPASRSIQETPFDKDLENMIEQAKEEPDNHELVFKAWVLEHKVARYKKNNN